MASPYPRAGARRRAVAAWCLFDFANSSYTTLITTVAFAVFFKQVVLGADGSAGDRLWGQANFIAMVVVVLVSPVLGALADYSGRRKLLLILTTLQTVVATALLFFVGPGAVVPAMLLYAVATIGFESGYVFYNSFLPDVSTPQTIGRISGWAWAIGYVGGLAALLLCGPLLASDLRAPGGELVPAAIRDRQWSFAAVALFYFVFALPAFLWLRESVPVGRPSHWTRYPAIGFRRVLHTIRHLREYRETGKFVLASLFYNDAITTIIIFSAPFATDSFGFGGADLVRLFLVLNVVAFPGAVLAGYLSDAIGPRRTLMLTLVLWTAVVVTGFLGRSPLAFWAMACGAALGMASTQSVSRAFMAQISPPEREAEFFGFYVLSGKFASTVGPLLFGYISSASGNQHLAVLSLLPLFLIGLALLYSVNERRAIRMARAEP